jgi:hypothetical protein
MHQFAPGEFDVPAAVQQMVLLLRRIAAAAMPAALLRLLLTAAAEALTALPAGSLQARLLPAHYDAMRVLAELGRLDEAADVIDVILKGVDN